MLGKKEHRTFKYPGGRRNVSTAHKLHHRRWSDKILWILVVSDSHLLRGSLWDLGKTIMTKCQALQQNLAPKRQLTHGCGEEMNKTRELAEHILHFEYETENWSKGERSVSTLPTTAPPLSPRPPAPRSIMVTPQEAATMARIPGNPELGSHLLSEGLKPASGRTWM